MQEHIFGSENNPLNNIVDNDVIIEGNNNQVRGLVFTNPKTKLIINGKECPIN